MLIETIPHKEQRYDTCGDWWIDEQRNWHVRVSQCSDWRYEFLVALHELVEMAGCVAIGIHQDDVTSFDLNFSLERREGEPGAALDAPYRTQHERATAIEQSMAQWLGVDWSAYDKEIEAL